MQLWLIQLGAKVMYMAIDSHTVLICSFLFVSAVVAENILTVINQQVLVRKCFNFCGIW